MLLILNYGGVMNQLKTYEQLVELLKTLDKAIETQIGKNFKITVQAVGGFALMFHGLRINNPLSRDIDSMTELPSNVYKLALDIDPSGWLNDHVSVEYGLPKRHRENLVFVDSKIKFSCINLEIAVLESLMAMKLHALDNMTLRGYTKQTNPRTQDASDVKEIFNLYNIKSQEDFVREFPGLDCYLDKKYLPDEEKYKEKTDKINIFEKYDLIE